VILSTIGANGASNLSLSLNLFIILRTLKGHTVTGQVAQQFLTAETAKQVGQILSPTYQGLLGDAVTWADKIKFISGYK